MSLAQPDAEGSLVKWMPLSEALERNEKEPRPIIVDFYTSWCGWCKQMMRTTYADPGLAQYINTYFYPAKFDAEGKDTIEYLGKKYGPSSTAPRATHELTLKLLGKLMYPTTLFLNNYDKEKKEFGVSMLAAGYLERQKIEPLLVYQVENVFRSSAYDDFGDAFQKAFYDTVNAPPRPHLLAASDVFRKDAVPHKKTLVFISTDWCNSCRVMQRTTFSDSLVAGYLAEKFNVVELDAQSQDTLYFKGMMYTHAASESSPFHPLAMALSRNSLVLPTLTVLDEKMDPLDAIGYFMHPAFLDLVAHYFGDDIYKSKSWKDYVAERKSKKAEPATTR